jgi:hypothetical protein
MDVTTRDLVWQRAGTRCEYCLLNMNAPRRVQLREEWLREGGKL